MRLVDCEQRHELLRGLLVDHKVVPERTRLNDHGAFDEEREKCLHKVILLIGEGAFGKSYPLNDLVLLLKCDVFNSRHADFTRFFFRENLALILIQVRVDCAEMLGQKLLNVVDFCKRWRLLCIGNLEEWNQALSAEANQD